MVMDCDPDDSRETRRTPPRKAAFHDCRAAPGCVLPDEPRARTASARPAHLSMRSLVHRHNGTTASGTRRSMTGWLALSFCQSTQFSGSHRDLTTEDVENTEKFSSVTKATKVRKGNASRRRVREVLLSFALRRSLRPSLRKPKPPRPRTILCRYPRHARS